MVGGVGEPGEIDGKTIRVLVADDSPIYRDELVRALRALPGVEVVGAVQDGLEAVERAVALKPNAVVMDQNMPRMTGVQATVEIKRAAPQVRVLFLAAELQWLDEALKAGAEAYFTKDAGLGPLLRAIRRGPPASAPAARPAYRPPQSLWRKAGAMPILFPALLLALIVLLVAWVEGVPPLSILSLAFGLLFFLYALKYYSSVLLLLWATSGPGQNGNGHNGNGRNGNGHNGASLKGLVNHGGGSATPKRHPFVSVHLPMYNEKDVVNRLLTACTSFDYDNYEVIVADDSTDGTTQILKQHWGRHPRVRISHRADRGGFKGGALRLALERTDPRAEFVIVFDADFVPPPGIVQQFLTYFFGANGDGGGSDGLLDERVAAVQGYQWHCLNASENWITRGVRAEFSGSYVVERPAQELLGSMKMIAGSVFMIRADVLRAYGWSGSITEDWELTCRLYRDGYRVLYTPFIQASGECVSSFDQLTRQRMRWAEGHTFNVKRHFASVLRSPHLTLPEKAEFVYYASYYLQSLFFLLGTGSWFLTELVLHLRLPFWSAALGWGLVFTNFFSLGLMNLVGLFLERGVKRNWSGLLSFAILTYMLVPYQAYAALRGLLEKEEGGWHRTLKTGVVTEVLGRLGLKRIRRLLPRQRHLQPGRPLGAALTAIRSLIPEWVRRPLRHRDSAWRATYSLTAVMMLGGLAWIAVPFLSAHSTTLYLHDAGLPLSGSSTRVMSVEAGGAGATLAFDAPGDGASWDLAEAGQSGLTATPTGRGNYRLSLYFASLPPDAAPDNVAQAAGPGAETAAAGVRLRINLLDVASNGTADQLIASRVVTINSRTPNPLIVDLSRADASGSASTVPSRLRLQIVAEDVPVSGGLILAYDALSRPSHLEVPGGGGGVRSAALLLALPLAPYPLAFLARRRRPVVHLISVLMATLVVLGLAATRVDAAVGNTSTTFWFYDDTAPQRFMMYQAQPGGANSQANAPSFYSDTFDAGWSITPGTSTVVFWATNTAARARTYTVSLSAGGTQLGSGSISVPANTTSPTLFSVSFSTSGHTFSANQRLRVRFAAGAGGLRVLWDGANNTSRLQVPGLSVPESAVGLAGVGLLIPLAVAALRRRHARPLSRGTRGGRDRG